MSGVLQRDWRIELASALPDFFSPSPGRPLCVPACGLGWRDILDRCVLRIDAALEEGESFRFERIAERHGVMRIYWGGRLSAASEAAVREAIDLAEARSQCVCELCGDRGRLHRCDGVVKARCDLHAEGAPAVEVRPGFEDVHLTQQTIAGRMRAVVVRRYDFELDAFVDFDPSSAGEEG
jgi:hypothetical protein